METDSPRKIRSKTNGHSFKDKAIANVISLTNSKGLIDNVAK
jgi:hypothetical protein